MRSDNNIIVHHLPEDSNSSKPSSSDNNHLPPEQKNAGIIIAIIIIGLVAGALIWGFNRIADPDKITPIDEEDWPTIAPAGITATPTFTPHPQNILPTATPSPTPLPTPTPIVVGWHELGYLTSVEYTLQTVVEVEREQVLLGVISSKDRVLLLAVGNVQAGIDMSAIKDKNVTINGTTVKLTLPRAQVTGVELLPTETRIYDSEQSWFLSEYEGIEVEALNTARIQLESWAVDRNAILSQAEKTASRQLFSFLRQLGFEDIEITFEN